MYYGNKGYIPILKAVHRAFVSMVGRRGTREPTPNPAFLTPRDHKTTHIPPHMTPPPPPKKPYILSPRFWTNPTGSRFGWETRGIPRIRGTLPCMGTTTIWNCGKILVSSPLLSFEYQILIEILLCQVDFCINIGNLLELLSNPFKI